MRDNYPSAIRGAAALQEALDLIGGDHEGEGDKMLAKVIVDNEVPLRDLVRHFLNSVSNDL